MVAVRRQGNQPDDPADVAALGRYATALVDAVAAALPTWVDAVVRARFTAWYDEHPPAAVVDDAVAAGAAAVSGVVPALRHLLGLDVDDQRASPLELIRAAVAHPTGVLARAGVPPVARDADAARRFPDDVYDLTPGSLAEVHPSLAEPGLTWGAAKAHVILRRRART